MCVRRKQLGERVIAVDVSCGGSRQYALGTPHDTIMNDTLLQWWTSKSSRYFNVYIAFRRCCSINIILHFLLSANCGQSSWIYLLACALQFSFQLCVYCSLWTLFTGPIYDNKNIHICKLRRVIKFNQMWFCRSSVNFFLFSFLSILLSLPVLLLWWLSVIAALAANAMQSSIVMC